VKTHKDVGAMHIDKIEESLMKMNKDMALEHDRRKSISCLNCFNSDKCLYLYKDFLLNQCLHADNMSLEASIMIESGWSKRIKG
jgi:hypothetical protein